MKLQEKIKRGRNVRSIKDLRMFGGAAEQQEQVTA